jgi:leucyl aminopeptidase (aminopeptidase T)
VDDSSYTEARASSIASIVLKQTLRVKAGETVTVEAWSAVRPWAMAFVREARRMGAFPLVLYEDEETYWQSVAEAKPAVVGTLPRHEQSLLEKTDAYVYFWGPADRGRFEKADGASGGALTRFNDPWYAVANRARLRLVRMYLGLVSPQDAKRYHIGYAEWRNEVVEASLVEPESMHSLGAKVAKRFEHGDRVVVTHPNGTHLELRLKHRQPNLFAGVLESEPAVRGKRNMHGTGVRDSPYPAGVVSVAVDEEFAEGTLVSNAPTRTRDTPWSGGQWEFSGGHLVSYRYTSGRAEFQRRFAAGRKGRDQPAALSVGLNPKLHESPLMVDQELGTVTLSIGSNRFLGGTTEAGFFTWMFLRGADVAIDGASVVRKGRIVSR